jgi:hypothetical protein
VSEAWKPRPHDHLVEPLFGGLKHHVHEERDSRAIWIGVAIVAISLAVRIVTLSS